MQEVESKLVKLFQVVFFDLEGKDAETITGYAREDSPTWDSAAHLLLLTCVEEEFGVKIPDEEAIDMDSFKKTLSYLL